MGRRGLLEIVFNMSGSIFQNVVDFWMYVRKTGAFCLGALELLCGSVRDQLWALKILLDISPTLQIFEPLRDTVYRHSLDYLEPSCSENDVKQSQVFLLKHLSIFRLCEGPLLVGTHFSCYRQPRILNRKTGYATRFPCSWLLRVIPNTYIFL